MLRAAIEGEVREPRRLLVVAAISCAADSGGNTSVDDSCGELLFDPAAAAAVGVRLLLLLPLLGDGVSTALRLLS